VSFWVYPLRCADGSYYAGHTDDLDKRIGEHVSGACGGYTATRLPVQLVFSQECATRIEALGFERQIKGWSRAKKEALVRGDWGEVSRLAKGKSST
jgi:predicted GIY-YIG superfamily endonuclease